MLQQSGLLKADGTFDGPAAVAKLKAATNKTEAWSDTIQKVVDECIAKGNSILFNKK
jgi:hypothetical protein